MNNNQKIGSIIVNVEGTSLTATDKVLLQHPHVGGVILFSYNYQNPEQIIAFIQEIRQVRQTPLLITVDQEGGRIQRFREGLTPLLSLGKIGEFYDICPHEIILQLSKECGWVMAAEMLALGVDVSFAPVLDINRKLNQVIGDRSFNQDPLTIVALAEWYIAGMREAGMAAIGKHFPGHGGVMEDTHTDQAIDTRSWEVLEAEDLYPFKQLIASDHLQGIMPSHIVYRALDEQPAGFSKPWLQDVLRRRYGFTGTIFSDDLSMRAANVVGDLFERVLVARAAGCDFVLICNNPKELAGLLQKMEETEQPLIEQPVNLFSRHPYTWQELQQDKQWQAMSHNIKTIL